LAFIDEKYVGNPTRTQTYILTDTQTKMELITRVPSAHDLSPQYREKLSISPTCIGLYQYYNEQSQLYAPVRPVSVGTIACCPSDAGQMIDRHDRPIADFADTELSSNQREISLF